MNPLFNKYDLSGRCGVITGGGGKMGAEFAATLLQANAAVVLVDISAANLEASRKFLQKKRDALLERATPDSENIKSFMDRVLFLNLESEGAGNQGLEKQIHQANEKIKTWAGQKQCQLTFFVHNVMAKPEGYYKALESYPLSAWNQVMESNLTSAFLFLRGLLPQLLESKKASVVLTSSIYGSVGPDQRIYVDCSASGNQYGQSDPLSCPAVYSASKGALIGFSRYLATTYGAKGLRSNVLTPGGVKDGQEDNFVHAYEQRVPLGRMATWSDYNEALLFLVSDASRYVTGTNLTVDGGWTAW